MSRPMAETLQNCRLPAMTGAGHQLAGDCSSVALDVVFAAECAVTACWRGSLSGRPV